MLRVIKFCLLFNFYIKIILLLEGILAEKANISRHMLPGIRMPGKEAKRDRAEMDRAIVIFQDLTDADLRWFWRVYGQN